MRVLFIEGYNNLIHAMADREDMDLSVMYAPDAVERLERDGRFRHVFPYVAKAKLDLRAAWQVRQAIKQTEPDVVHAFYGKPISSAVLGTLGMQNCPKIISFRGVTSPLSVRDPSNFITYWHPKVVGHACESDAVRQALIDGGVSQDRCVTTYGCVPADDLLRPGRAALQPWGIPDDAFVVCTVANMRPVKGADILLRAATQCADLSQVYWVLIGQVLDPQVERLAEHPRIRERVRLLGYRPEASELVSGADLFVLPSRREGLCKALLEAMAQRVCPVVSEAGGLKEAVRHQVDGHVVPCEDVDALAQAIRSLYEDRDLAKSYAESACERARGFFSSTSMCERTVALYERVLAA